MTINQSIVFTPIGGTYKIHTKSYNTIPIGLSVIQVTSPTWRPGGKFSWRLDNSFIWRPGRSGCSRPVRTLLSSCRGRSCRSTTGWRCAATTKTNNSSWWRVVATSVSGTSNAVEDRYSTNKYPVLVAVPASAAAAAAADLSLYTRCVRLQTATLKTIRREN